MQRVTLQLRRIINYLSIAYYTVVGDDGEDAVGSSLKPYKSKVVPAAYGIPLFNPSSPVKLSPKNLRKRPAANSSISG